jgi:hypothetical protein
MAGANLQVKVGAEVEGFLGQMRRVDSEFTRVTRGVNEHGFALNKAQRAIEAFAVEATGAIELSGRSRRHSSISRRAASSQRV